jgi:hypothetical protein
LIASSFLHGTKPLADFNEKKQSPAVACHTGKRKVSSMYAQRTHGIKVGKMKKGKKGRKKRKPGRNKTNVKRKKKRKKTLSCQTQANKS